MRFKLAQYYGLINVHLDKITHFALSALLVMWLNIILGNLGAAVIVTVNFGIIKELMDLYFAGRFCWFDMLANILGIVCSIFFLL